eukprot:jgi/Tetstr1/446794/TSEL_034275.t1
MLGTFSLPVVDRPPHGGFDTARLGKTGSSRLHADLASLGGQRSRLRGRVGSGSTNRPTAGQLAPGSGGLRRCSSGASSRSSGSSSGSSINGLGRSLSSTSVASGQRPATVDPSGSGARRPMNLYVREDRAKVRAATDKINGKRLADMRTLFRTLRPERDGKLNAAQLREGLGRYCFWIEPADVDKLLGSLDREGSGSVDYNQLIELLGTYTPLGPYTNGRGGDALLLGAPWEPLELRNEHFVAFSGERYPAPPYLKEGADDEASFASDARTFNLVNARFYQSANRIRNVFRKLDADRNGIVDEREFVSGVGRLGLSIPDASLRKFFSLIHDGSGKLDYVEFLARFDGEGEIPRLHPPERGGPPPFDVEPAKVEEVAGGTAAAALRERLAAAVHSSSHAPFALFRRYDVDGDGVLSAMELRRLVKGVAPELELSGAEVDALMADVDPATDGYLDYRAFATKLADGRPPHPRAARPPLGGGTDPLDTSYQGMQGGARRMLGASCLPHGPGEPPVTHPTVATLHARTNALRTEQRAPALESLWASLSDAAAAGRGAYSRQPTTPHARPDSAPASDAGEAPSGSGSPLPSEEANSRPQTCSASTRSAASSTGGRLRATFGSTFGPSPGAPGGARTGVQLDPRWSHAVVEGATLSAKYSPFKSTAALTVPAAGTASAWDPATHFDPKPGVGAPQRSTTVDEREEKGRARARADARFSGKAAYLAARKSADTAAAEALDAARVASKSHMRRRDAERTHFYSQFGATPTDKESHTFFMRKF